VSLVEVARRDFLDYRRSKVVWFVLVSYAGFAAIYMFISTDQYQYYETLREAVIQILSSVLFVGSLLVPLIALVAGSSAIAGERETGSAKFLLGLPNTRWDVILGKFLSRSLVIALSIIGAFTVVAGFLLTIHPVFPVIPYLVMFGLIFLYTVAYTAVVIGISASVASKARAVVAGFGLYFVLNIFTLFVPFGAIVRTIHADILGFIETPMLYRFFSQLVPSQALMRGVGVFGTEGVSVSALPSDAPFYVQAGFMPVILCGWIIVPLVFGYYRFSTADVS
jgi:ABC-2 type transport system permease protein